MIDRIWLKIKTSAKGGGARTHHLSPEQAKRFSKTSARKRAFVCLKMRSTILCGNSCGSATLRRRGIRLEEYSSARKTSHVTSPGRRGRKSIRRVLSIGVAGQVAELADALDLGSSGATRQSSSLCLPTLDGHENRIDTLNFRASCFRGAGRRVERRVNAREARRARARRVECSGARDALRKRPQEPSICTQEAASDTRGSSSVVEHRLAKARVASSNLVFR